MARDDGRTDRTIAPDWLTRGGVARLLAVLDAGGEEARVVGGAVRNELLGEPVHEVDIATTAVPDAVVRRVTAAGFKPVPTGLAHGTVTVVIDGAPFEVTTLRTDVETFGRHATVAFGRDWRADAMRRDFTINALSVTRDGAVHDYTDGLADLAVRRVRFIGDARSRIAEDYLRILRFFRFHAAYGHGPLDRDGLHAAIMERAGLARLSRERVRMEMLKLVVARGAVPVVRMMADIGLVLDVCACVPNLAHFAAMAGIETSCGLPPDAMRRLAALCVLVAEDAERLWQRLRLTNKEHERLGAMAQGWRRVSPARGDGAGKDMLYRTGPDTYRDRTMLGWARSGAAHDASDWRNLLELPRRWTAPVFPVKAVDMMARGVDKGPALGAALARAEADWIAAGFPGDATALAAIADKSAALSKQGT